ncbi:hypothetical protein C8A05DRAFT_18032 [Staphylotrichum tortipilum]|uniref:C2H2-type domain-containing protein n=1 Tax=Staphylotrichum tortipilum TaxID=2831512 RepID=A0AAN6RRK1_9PEZI|nr:hypothetical protein C8A05DRAFT_18032 [Staphylotrichum longicolle]
MGVLDDFSSFGEVLFQVGGDLEGSASSVHGGTPRPEFGESRPEVDDTYTCTYHGCKLRFRSPFLLQKHKREDHRHPHGLAAWRGDVGGTASSVLNTQAGPHRCDRNPSTGMSCNGVFSRPYDLTRHEDTIHNTKKQKVRCYLCIEEKTFSRADALSRHYRVCHPDTEIPGQKRRPSTAATMSGTPSATEEKTLPYEYIITFN